MLFVKIKFICEKINKYSKLIKALVFLSFKFGLRHSIIRLFDFCKITFIKKQDNKKYLKTKPQGKIIKNIMGNKIELDMSDWGIHKDLFLYGKREPRATDYLNSILNKQDIALEVGANIGYYALQEAKICKKIYAIEPVKENYENLIKNIVLNNYNNIETFQLALGNTTGQLPMYISHKSNWHSFYKNENLKNTQLIKMDTGDNFLKLKESPTFLRMDVEGYELEILKGLKNSLAKFKNLFIEVHADIIPNKEVEEFFQILKTNNFYPTLIIKYDRPKFIKVLPNNYIENIVRGDKGNYEIFFTNEK